MMRLMLSVCLLAFSISGGGGRGEWVTETYNEHVWVITGAEDGRELCRLITTSDRLPALPLINALCGQWVGDTYRDGQAVIKYLYTAIRARQIKKPLPAMDIQLAIDTTAAVPVARVTASEPMEEEQIERIEARLGERPVVCASSPCEIPLPNLDTATITYWAESTYGDATRRHTAMLANTAENSVAVYGDRTVASWTPAQRVPHLWMQVPPETPPWLQQATEQDLYTDAPLYYLAGQLILSGALGVPECDNWGIERWSGGYADQCGLAHARQAVNAHQNLYNAAIVDAAEQSGVPSALLKGIIAQESQFWQGAVGSYGEAGLYQLTRAGADTLLRWDGSAYLDYCSWYHSDCATVGYDNREPWQQDLLISAVLRDATDDIDLLGDVLTANAAQVERILEKYEGEEMGYLARWRITIGNYHSGPALTAAVLDQLRQLDKPRTWASYAETLGEMQPGVLAYIYAVTGETQTEPPLDFIK